MTEHARRWPVPPRSLSLRGQENNYPITAEDEVGGGFLCGIALAGDHPAVDHRPAVVLRVAEAEVAERGAAGEPSELLVEHGDVEFQGGGGLGTGGGILGQPEHGRGGDGGGGRLLADPGAGGGILGQPEHGRDGDGGVARLLADPAAVVAEGVAAQYGHVLAFVGRKIGQDFADRDRRNGWIGRDGEGSDEQGKRNRAANCGISLDAMWHRTQKQNRPLELPVGYIHYYHCCGEVQLADARGSARSRGRPGLPERIPAEAGRIFPPRSPPPRALRFCLSWFSLRKPIPWSSLQPNATKRLFALQSWPPG